MPEGQAPDALTMMQLPFAVFGIERDRHFVRICEQSTLKRRNSSYFTPLIRDKPI
jgi:hypothetical protein